MGKQQKLVKILITPCVSVKYFMLLGKKRDKCKHNILINASLKVREMLPKLQCKFVVLVTCFYGTFFGHVCINIRNDATCFIRKKTYIL